jgi:hypothetical protein
LGLSLVRVLLIISGFNGGTLVETGAINITENSVEAGAQIRGVSALFSASDDLEQYDIAGAVQYSKSIGMGLSLIINDIQRKTRNSIDPSGGFTLTGNDGFTAEAENSGRIYTIAVAGAISNSKGSATSAQDAPSNDQAISKWMPSAKGLAIAGSGSIVINNFSNNEASSNLAKLTGSRANISTNAVLSRPGILLM